VVDAKAANKAEWIKCIEEDRLQEFEPKELPLPCNTSQIAIVVFEHQCTKELFIHTPTVAQSLKQFFCTPCQPLSHLTVKGEHVGIERAPEPDEIFWENTGISMNGSICRKVSFGLICLLILLIGGSVQYGLAILTNKVTTSSGKIFFKILNPTFVVAWSTFIQDVIIELTEKERNETVTEFQAVLVVKLALMQFLNAGIFVVGTRILAGLPTFDLGTGVV
jgi:hypothetical protein